MREGSDTFTTLLGVLDSAIEGFPDNRKGKNLSYTMRDFTMSAFSVFFSQSPSFLAHQRSMQLNHGDNNGRTLFGIQKLPTDAQVRNVLDGVESRNLHEVFHRVLLWLQEKQLLDSWRHFDMQLLVCLDGTQFFHSDAIGCDYCSLTHHRDGRISRAHSAVTPVIVAPGNSKVIALAPEIVRPQDGKEKQDCESQAAKRWIESWGPRYKELGITLLGDDLYSRQPTCQLALDNGFSFLFVCKPSSHPWLSDWIGACDVHKDLHERRVQVREGKKRLTYIYRWANGVPLKDDKKPLVVSWAELIVQKETGEQSYRNSWVTNHTLSDENVCQLVQAGRCRWKIENENNNTLKTKGYHLEHNFGHGKKELANFLLTLNLIAFLFHTVLDIFDARYRLLRRTLVRRVTFFQDIQALTRYMCFGSWEEMLQFMLRGLQLEDPGG
jgi:hypothetical protein